MLTFDERLMIGIKALEKLRPNLRWQRRNLKPPFAAVDSPAHLGGVDRNVSEEDQQPYAMEGNSFAGEAPTLEELLKQNHDLPPNSLVMGACADGLPFLVELTNPAPGSLLILGDRGSGKTRLLRATLASAAHLNTIEEAAFHLVVQNPEEYHDLSRSLLCRGLFTPDETTTAILIEELADLVERRRRTRPELPAIVLLIDDLASFRGSMDEGTYERLFWLIRHGPRSRVWTLAALSSERMGEIEAGLLTAFRTRLTGYLENQEMVSGLNIPRRAKPRKLIKGMQFCVPYQEDWLYFQVCDPKLDLLPEQIAELLDV